MSVAVVLSDCLLPLLIDKFSLPPPGGMGSYFTSSRPNKHKLVSRLQSLWCVQGDMRPRGQTLPPLLL